MIKAYTLISLIFLTTLSSCVFSKNKIHPTIKETSFSGISIDKNNKTIKLKDAIYTVKPRTDKEFTNCEKVISFSYEKIIPFEQFQFKALTALCTAVNKYQNANYSESSFFPSTLTNVDIENLPALTTPYINSFEYNSRINKTIKQAHEKLTISNVNSRTKILTEEDELYIDIVARGDFNNDKIEDLLVNSDWYARNAFGKHTDLVILTKTGKDKPITIEWRLNKPR